MVGVVLLLDNPNALQKTYVSSDQGRWAEEHQMRTKEEKGRQHVAMGFDVTLQTPNTDVDVSELLA